MDRSPERFYLKTVPENMRVVSIHRATLPPTQLLYTSSVLNFTMLHLIPTELSLDEASLCFVTFDAIVTHK